MRLPCMCLYICMMYQPKVYRELLMLMSDSLLNYQLYLYLDFFLDLYLDLYAPSAVTKENKPDRDICNLYFQNGGNVLT